ncbi:hypothetical protein [Sporosarcina sp. FA9]|uniref:hypothetical protein n=1 Tax=Sporosarcina sp. FA9 TaxID=3413030 RepID=UPI003F65D96A
MINLKEEKGILKYSKLYNNLVNTEEELKELQKSIEFKESEQSKIRSQVKNVTGSFEESLPRMVQNKKEVKRNEIKTVYENEVSSARDKYENDIANTKVIYGDKVTETTNEILIIQREGNVEEGVIFTKENNELVSLIKHNDKYLEESRIISSYLPNALAEKVINSVDGSVVSAEIFASKIPGKMLLKENKASQILKSTGSVTATIFAALLLSLKFLIKPFKDLFVSIIYWIIIIAILFSVGDSLISLMFSVFSIILVIMGIGLAYFYILKPLIALLYLNQRKEFMYIMKNLNTFIEEEKQRQLLLDSKKKELDSAELKQQISMIQAELEEKLKSDKDLLELQMDEIKVKLDEELHKVEATPQIEWEKEELKSHEMKMRELKDEITNVNNKLSQLNSKRNELENEIQRLRAQLENGQDLLLSRPLKEETEGAISDTLYVLGKKEKEFVPIYEIKHYKEPLVLLYNNDENQITQQSTYIDSVIESIIESVIRINYFEFVKLSIVDIVAGAKKFLGPRYQSFLKVFDTNADIKDFTQQIEQSANRVARSQEGDITVLNKKRFADGDPIYPFYIPQIVIPPKGSTSSVLQLSDEFWRASKEGDKYGFIPIFYVSKQDWEAFEQETDDNKHSDKLFKNLKAVVPVSNYYEIDIKRNAFQKYRNSRSV